MAAFRLSILSFVFLASLGTFPVLGCDEGISRRFLSDDFSNLVLNGDFERPRVRPGTEYLSYSAGDRLTGWSIDGPIDLLSGPIWEPAEGNQSLDLDGSCGTGGIHQDLPTEPGILYALRFALAGNPNGSPTVKALEVSWGDTVVDTVVFDTTGGTKGNPGWGARGYTVVATREITRLTFRSLSAGCYGALLDAVSVRKIPSI